MCVGAHANAGISITQKECQIEKGKAERRSRPAATSPHLIKSPMDEIESFTFVAPCS